MVCEGVLNLFGTSSKEIEERTRKQYIPQIQKLTEEKNALASENSTLASKLNMITSKYNQLEQLLIQHNIDY